MKDPKRENDNHTKDQKPEGILKNFLAGFCGRVLAELFIRSW